LLAEENERHFTTAIKDSGAHLLQDLYRALRACLNDFYPSEV
jgi:hypothetical protein